MILPKITQKQKLILLLLYKFRFLTTTQLQKILKHKNPKRTQSWLKDLKEKKYIARIYSRDSRANNTKPAIYYLSSRARHILKTNDDCTLAQLEKIYKEGKRTLRFMEECMTIADIYISFLFQKKPTEELKFFTESNLAEFDYFPTPLPKAYIVIKIQEITQRYFLDYFDELTPPSVWDARTKLYLSYADSNDWEDRTNSSLPSVIFVCPTEKIKRRLHYYTKSLLEKTFDDVQIFLKTTTEINNYKNTNTVWQKVKTL